MSRLETMEWYKRRQSLASDLAVAAAFRARDLDADRVPAVVSAAQMAVATSAALSVPAILAEQGIASDPVAEVRVARLVGVASDGRGLSSLIALAGTDAEFERIVRTQLSDVARAAEALAAAVEPAVTAYVRAVSLPACGRCLVLAGRIYSTEVAFDRHPQCDCRHIPTDDVNAESLVTNPREAFAAMTAAEQARSVTKAGAEAIRLGADMSQVVNARAGMSTAQISLRGNGDRWTAAGRLRSVVGPGGRQIYTTTEGTTQYGTANRLMRERSTTGATRVRLMPESILALSRDRADTIRLLRLYGYIT